MEAAGVHVAKHYKERPSWPFCGSGDELAHHFKEHELCKKDIAAYKPDALVLVDYPGFNMRIAEWGKQQGFQTSVLYLLA